MKATSATAALDKYFALVDARPEFFTASPALDIILESAILEDYIQKTGAPLGLAYASAYHYLVVDLVRDASGRLFPYERVLPVSQGQAVVCAPIFDGKFILLNQFRHAIRSSQLCFPRGFGENGLTAVENARKELFEETGAVASTVEIIGRASADSGLSGTFVDVALCVVPEFSPPSPQTLDEGIANVVLLSLEELEEKIANREIEDGFTLAAYALCVAQKRFCAL